MKLLMVTRKVDAKDTLAGFTYNWAKKLGKNLDQLYVISWQPSDRGDLPENVKIISLPRNKLFKIIYLQKMLFSILPKVDGIFCHMNPEYTILSAPLAKIFRKRVVSWYTHKGVSFRRHLMERLADRIVTASAMSFREPLFPKKVEVLGHGIDVDIFKPGAKRGEDGNFEIISIGRISPTKDYESIIKAVGQLNNKNVQFKIIGDVVLEDQRSYLDSLKTMVVVMGLSEQVKFLGGVANKDLAPYYQRADLFINMSGTGSIDKVVLEAMACGCLVLTSNEAFSEILPADLMVQKNDYKKLAEKINWLRQQSNKFRADLTQNLRGIVVNNHNLDKLVEKIIKQFHGEE